MALNMQHSIWPTLNHFKDLRNEVACITKKRKIQDASNVKHEKLITTETDVNKKLLDCFRADLSMNFNALTDSVKYINESIQSQK